MEGGRGAAVMTNGDRGASLAGEILRAVAAAYGWPSHQQEVRETVELTAVQMAPLVGSYLVPEVEWDFRVTVQDGILRVSSRGGEPTDLYPASETEFFRLEDGVTIEFELGEDGQATAFVLADEIRAERR